MSNPKHILIVGDGVIGRCVAFYALRQGHQVSIVERGLPDHDGCSFGNAGMIVPSHFVPLAAPGMVALGLKWMWNPESPFYIKPRLQWDLLSWGFKFWRAATHPRVAQAAPLLRDLNLASRDCFQDLAQHPDHDFGLVQKGLLMLCKSQQTLDEEAHLAERARSLGVPAEVLSAKQTAELDPQVRMDIVGSVYFPKDCHLSPNRFMQALRQRLEQQGASFHWDAPVTGWRTDHHRIQAVQTPRGEFTADEFVLCGGSWSPLLGRSLGLRLPMQAGKGYSLTLAQPRQLPSLCAIFTEARLAVTPMGTSLRVGGTMEIAGLNEDINPLRVQGIIKSVPKYYPDFRVDDFKDVPVWRGLRPCSPDGLPYVGRAGRYQNLSIATGHAMLGLSLAPITGRLISEILSGQKPSIDIALLHPDRYA